MNRVSLPRVKEMFVPDPDHIMFDADLAGADAQVVAWEAGDEKLKEGFRTGAPIHLLNARDLFDDPQLQTCTDKEAKANPRLNTFRQKAKVGVHATNYGCRERTLASHLGISVAEATRFQDRWFSTHPEIEQWHRAVEHSLQTTRTVTNKFGYRRQYFDRISEILPQALAWIPQSTVALCINRGWVQLVRSGLPAEILLQVHDSIVGQFHRRHLDNDPAFPKRIIEAMTVVIPYDDPLIIPVSIGISDKSWGHCKET